MITILGKAHRLAFLPLLFALLFGTSPLKYAKPKLSDYNFFRGHMADHQPKESVLPYDVSAQLFSDYALKSRFIALPKNQQLVYQKDGTFNFPQESVLIKTFYYPNNFRSSGQGSRLIEECMSINCPLYDFRFGKNPHHTQNLTAEQRKERGERLKSSVPRHKLSQKVT